MMKYIKITKIRVVLVILSIVLIAYIFVMIPLGKGWKDLERRIDKANIQYLRGSQTVRCFDDSLRQFKEYERKMKQTKSNEEEVALFLKEIELFIKQVKVDINDIKPLPDEMREETHVFLIKVELECTIQDLVVLLHTIASSQTLIRVEKMDMTTQSYQQSKLTVTLVFSKTFLL
ncbi:MAG: hypothetical protein ABIH47_05430 [Candidatus Omnitrophota bacterium]